MLLLLTPASPILHFDIFHCRIPPTMMARGARNVSKSPVATLLMLARNTSASGQVMQQCAFHLTT